ncbi:MAG TPA: PAS domain S-box protein [Rubrobacter sp.]|nr:PAS domain S-box protein [Rubrobacter sp.]
MGTPDQEQDDRWLRSVLERSSEIIKVVDPDGTLRYASPAFEKVFGYDRKEAVDTLNVFDHVHPDDLSRVLEEAEKAMAEGSGARNVAEYRFRHKDGTWLWVESVGTYLSDDPTVRGVVVTVRVITERKEAEERRRFQAQLLGAVGEAVTALDADGRVSYWNRAAEEIYGWSAQEALGRRLREMVVPEDLRGRAEEIMAGVREGKTWKGEFVVRRRDGTRFPVEATNTPVFGQDGEFVGVISVFRDVTARKRAESGLREAEKRYRTLVEQIPAVTYIDRADGSFEPLYTSPQIEEMLGFTPEEWIAGRLWEKRLHPEDRDRILAADDLLEVDGQPFNEEYRLRAKNGRVVWVHEEAVLVKGEAAEPLYWQGVIHDITERKGHEETLRRNEERFRSLVQNASEVILVMGGDEVVRYASPALEWVLGYRPEDVVGNDSFDVMHPDDKTRVWEIVADAVKSPGIPFHLLFRLRHADGSWRHMESKCTSLLDDPAVGGIVFNSRDVTVPKRAEEALRESERRFRSSFEDAAVGMALVGTDGRWLRVNRSLCEIVGYTEEELLERTFQDITHPEDLDKDLEQARRLLKGEIRSYQIEKRYICKDGRVVWVLLNGSLVRDGAGDPLYFIAQIQDVSARKRMEGQLQRQALQDPLTGLPNRTLFVDRLGQALERTRRRKGHRVAVLFMDLDGFKVVNDSLGHEMGDLLLTLVAERLGRCLRPEDTLARFGGDEFVVLIEEVESSEEAVRVAGRIAEGLERPFLVNGHELFASASIGIGIGDVWTKTPEDLLRDSDVAMYRAKNGGSGYRVFEPAMYEGAMRRLALEGDLRRAIERDEFVVHYQPMASVSTGEIVGTEALVRWQHPDHGLLVPSEFIPVVEETGLIVPMGRLVRLEACCQVKEWQRRHPKAPPLGVSVNLSARQLRHPGLVSEVASALDQAALNPESLTLEITESTYVEDERSTGEALRRLKELGVRLAIDDFGVGYSSLSYLRYLPVDGLKLDRVLVGSLDKDAKNLAIVRASVDLGHALGMDVVAEGVETHEEFEELRKLGCDVGQGYYWWRPSPPEEADQLLASNPAPLPDRRPY